MRLTLTGRGVSITDAIRGYANKRMRRLEKFADRIFTSEMILSTEGQAIKVEAIITSTKRNTVVAKTVDPDLYAAIDFCVDRLVKQIKKRIEKANDHHPGTTRIAKQDAIAAAAEAEYTDEDE